MNKKKLWITLGIIGAIIATVAYAASDRKLSSPTGQLLLNGFTGVKIQTNDVDKIETDGTGVRIGGTPLTPGDLTVNTGALTTIRNSGSTWLSNAIGPGGEYDLAGNAYYDAGWKYNSQDQASFMGQENGNFSFYSAPVAGVAGTGVTWSSANFTIVEAGDVTIPQGSLIVTIDAVNGPILKLQNNDTPDVATADYPYAAVIVENIKDGGNAMQFKTDAQGFTQIVFSENAETTPMRLEVQHKATNAADEISFVFAGGIPLKMYGNDTAEIGVREDGVCGTGNVCSGTFVSTHTLRVNLSSSDSATGFYQRVGNVVSFAFRLTLDVITAGIATSVAIDLPQTTTNFASFTQASGVCISDGPAGTEQDEAIIFATGATQTATIAPNNPQITANNGWNCTMMYLLP